MKVPESYREGFPQFPQTLSFTGDQSKIERLRFHSEYWLKTKDTTVLDVYYGCGIKKTLCDSSLTIQITKKNQPSHEHYNSIVLSDSSKVISERVIEVDQSEITVKFLVAYLNENGDPYLYATFKKGDYYFFISTYPIHLYRGTDREWIYDQLIEIYQAVEV